MRMHKKIGRVVSGFLAALTLAVSMPYAAAETDRQTIRVAFPTQEGMSFFGHSGKVTGYNYDYLEKISEYTGWEMEYVPYGSADGNEAVGSAINDLMDGQVDLMGPLLKNAATEEMFEFPENSYGTVYTTLVALAAGSLRENNLRDRDVLRVGLWQTAETRNGEVLTYLKSENLPYEIVYYDTAAEQQQALVGGAVDVISSVSLSPVANTRIVAQFAPRPYYFASTKGNAALIDQLDYAIDCMNVETPNWRTELYNQYYGSEGTNRDLTAQELELLRQLQDSGEIIRGVMDPDSNPYAWYEGETARGIAADIFKATADRLGLTYEIVPVSTKEEYQAALDSGSVDVWMDMDGCYEDEGGNRYKGTDAYLTTTMSVLRHRGAAEKIERLVTDDEHITVKEIVSRVWPEAEVTVVDSLEQCREMVLSGQADAALLMSYSAQKLARDDVQNRLQVDIVPGAFLELRMGVNANDSVHFYGLWEKTLGQVADDMSEEVVQRYLEETATPNLLRYLFDHPVYFIAWCAVIFLLVLMVLLYVQSVKRKRRQEKISGQLAVALERAEEATQAKQEFFSKMSHDIRTP